VKTPAEGVCDAAWLQPRPQRWRDSRASSLNWTGRARRDHPRLLVGWRVWLAGSHPLRRCARRYVRPRWPGQQAGARFVSSRCKQCTQSRAVPNAAGATAAVSRCRRSHASPRTTAACGSKLHWLLVQPCQPAWSGHGVHPIKAALIKLCFPAQVVCRASPAHVHLVSTTVSTAQADLSRRSCNARMASMSAGKRQGTRCRLEHAWPPLIFKTMPSCCEVHCP